MFFGGRFFFLIFEVNACCFFWMFFLNFRPSGLTLVRLFRDHFFLRLRQVAKASTVGIAPLHLAAERGSVSMARLLLEAAADANATSAAGEVPLVSWFCFWGDFLFLALLILFVPGCFSKS